MINPFSRYSSSFSSDSFISLTPVVSEQLSPRCL